MTDAVRVSYHDIPHFPCFFPLGQLVLGDFRPMVVVQNVVLELRSFPMLRVWACARLSCLCGRWHQLSNSHGRLVVIKDHRSCSMGSARRCARDLHSGPRFIDMSEAYSKSYRKMAVDPATAVNRLAEGVSVAVLGPELSDTRGNRAFLVIGRNW